MTTRNRLIRATIDEISEVGYHAATTERIAQRAQVSRGALLHHFPTRADIISTAMEIMLEAGIERIDSASRKVREGKLSLDEFIDFLARSFSGPNFLVTMEMITGARSDAGLRTRLMPIAKRFHAALDDIWAEFCDKEKRPPWQAEIILNLTVVLFRGLGVQTVLRPDPAYYRDLVATWKALLPALISGPVGDSLFASQHFQATRNVPSAPLRRPQRPTRHAAQSDRTRSA